jgi:single-strand DNA-binding protein
MKAWKATFTYSAKADGEQQHFGWIRTGTWKGTKNKGAIRLNKVLISGRWVRDIETKDINGKTLAKCTIAVDEGYGDNKKSHYFDVEMWGKTADAVSNYSGKGKKVLVSGRLKVDTWEKDGQKRTATRIVAEEVEFLEKAQRETERAADPFADDGTPIEISDSDLPF